MDDQSRPVSAATATGRALKADRVQPVIFPLGQQIRAEVRRLRQIPTLYFADRTAKEGIVALQNPEPINDQLADAVVRARAYSPKGRLEVRPGRQALACLREAAKAEDASSQ